MSIATWKLEFYPINDDSVDKEDALKHSLRKWKGLRKEELQKHGLRQIGRQLIDNQERRFSIALCLCHLHRVRQNPCESCPLAKANNGISCDVAGNLSPYASFYFYQNPEPMIALIEKAIRQSE